MRRSLSVLLVLALIVGTHSEFVDYEEATPLLPYGDDASSLLELGEAVKCPTGACPIANGQCCVGHSTCCPGTSSCLVHPVIIKTVCPKMTPATKLILPIPPTQKVVGPSAIDPNIPDWEKDPLGAAKAMEKRLETKFKKQEHTDAMLVKPGSKTHPATTLTNQVDFLPKGWVHPAIKELKSLSGRNCDDRLDGYVLADRFEGQPRLNLAKAMKTMAELGKLPDMKFEVVGTEDGYKVDLLHLISHTDGAQRILITSGVHGNEPIGVTAMLELIAILYESDWRKYFDFTFVPDLNPGGLRDNFRTMRDGRDLNRLFTKKKFPKALQVLEKYTAKRKYAMSLDLHGAMKRSGFFVIKGGPDNGLVKRALKALDPKLLLGSDTGAYPGYVALNGDPRKYLLKNAGEATSNNPGTMKGFMASLGTPDTYTIEYPGQLPVCTRQAGLVTLTTAIIGNYIEMKKPPQTKS